MKILPSLAVTLVAVVCFAKPVQAQTPLFEVTERPLLGTANQPSGRAAWQTVVTVAQNGNWRTSTQRGRLSRAQLTVLQGAVHQTQFRVFSPSVVCAAVSTQQHRVRSLNQTIVWNSPCGQEEPDPSVDRLRQVVNQLTGQAGPIPPSAAPEPSMQNRLLTIEAVHDVEHARVRHIVISTGGNWFADGRTGSLTPDQVARLTVLVERVRVAPATRRRECGAWPLFNWTLTISGPTTITWVQPCDETPPVLGELVTTVIEATR